MSEIIGKRFVKREGIVVYHIEANGDVAVHNEKDTKKEDIWVIPKETFERTYIEADEEGISIDYLTDTESEFDFGMAITLLKRGVRIARKGWNGKGMYLAYQKGYPNGIAINKNTSEATGLEEGTVCKFLPYIMMKTVDNSFVPWLASQTDILAEDYVVVG